MLSRQYKCMAISQRIDTRTGTRPPISTCPRITHERNPARQAARISGPCSNVFCRRSMNAALQAPLVGLGGRVGSSRRASTGSSPRHDTGAARRDRRAPGCCGPAARQCTARSCAAWPTAHSSGYRQRSATTRRWTTRSGWGGLVPDAVAFAAMWLNLMSASLNRHPARRLQDGRAGRHRGRLAPRPPLQDGQAPRFVFLLPERGGLPGPSRPRLDLYRPGPAQWRR